MKGYSSLIVSVRLCTLVDLETTRLRAKLSECVKKYQIYVAFFENCKSLK